MASNEDIARELMRLFEGHAGAHGTHGKPQLDADGLKWSIKKTAKTTREPVTLALWVQHLKGERPLGVIPIREDNLCLWGSIDIDEYARPLLDVVEAVERSGLPLVPCRSKSGGLHLFMFIREAQPAGQVLAALRDIAAELGLAGCEIFPKQAQVLTDRGDVGNWMVMPYFGGTYNGAIREQVGLKKTGAEMTAGEFIREADKRSLTGEQFLALIQRKARPAQEQVSGGRQGSRRAKGGGSSDGMFADGPPCLQHLSGQGVDEHSGRNAALLMVGIYLRRARPTTWKADLEERNREMMNPPLPADEVQGVIKSLERKEYEYTCRVEPMASHCNSAVCRVRRFGVGGGAHYPVITGLSRMDCHPPIWFVDVEDQRLEVTTDELQNYVKFHRACMERLSRCYRLMKQTDWIEAVGSAMAGLVEVEAPQDVAGGERERELLEEFLTNRQRGTRREDILQGRPWEDEEARRHFFRLKDFEAFCQREGLRDVGRTRLGRVIEQLGGGAHFFRINGRGTNVRWVPSDVVTAIPEVQPPPVGGAAKV